MTETPSEVRTNPFVDVLPEFGDTPEFVVLDYDRNKRFELPNVGTVEVLDWATNGDERAALVERAATEFGIGEATARAVIDQLVERELLVPAAEYPEDLLDERAEWADAGWGTAFEFFHCIRDYPFYEDQRKEQAIERSQRRHEQYGDPPDVYVTLPDAETVALPEPDDSLESIRSLLGGPGGSSTTSLGIEDLSTLLYYAFGETGRQEIPGVREFLLKTSPSGGGRHPTEAYLLAGDLDGLDGGVYHYSVSEHALERIGGAERVAEAAGVAVPPPGAVELVLTARVERNMWKYRDPRAFRIPHHDVGHLMETVRLLCGALGYDVSFGPGRGGDALAAVLGVNRLREPLVGRALVEER